MTNTATSPNNNKTARTPNTNDKMNTQKTATALFAAVLIALIALASTGCAPQQRTATDHPAMDPMEEWSPEAWAEHLKAEFEAERLEAEDAERMSYDELYDIQN